MQPAARPMDDMVAEARASGSRSTELLYQRFQPLVRRILRGYRHYPLAEDLPGEVYLAFFRLVQQFDPARGVPFAHYLARMLPAAIHSVVRRERRILSHTLRWDDCRGGQGDCAALLEEPSACDTVLDEVVARQTLAEMMRHLTPRQAYVFVRRALGGEDYERIARCVGSSPAAVRTAYCAARQRLRREWGEKLSEAG